MSTDQPPQNPADPKPRKPGFFSRLFIAKKIDAAEEKAAADLPVTPSLDELARIPAEGDELIPPASAGPEGFNAQPELAEAAGEKKSIWSRWFGKKEEPPTTAAPAPEATPAAAPDAAPRKTWFERLRDRLRKSSGGFISAIRSAIGLSGRLDDDTVERLEEILIAADVGMETSIKIVEKLRKRARLESAEGADAIMGLFKETLTDIFTGNVKTFEPSNPDGPHVVMVVGVNGVGKTTTIGKMAKRCADAGLKVMLVAGDTFRAAAIEQLEIWAQRTGSDFIKSKHGADPSGLVFDALTAAKARGIDVVFIDTAGRLHTKTSLMDELGKVARVLGKVIPGAPHETLLILDATTGQNAVQQVKIFSSAVPVTGLVMTKLDGTAKGGILITIRDQFEIPITLIGVGEGVNDLRDFDPQQFVAALFEEEKAV